MCSPFKVFFSQCLCQDPPFFYFAWPPEGYRGDTWFCLVCYLLSLYWFLSWILCMLGPPGRLAVYALMEYYTAKIPVLKLDGKGPVRKAVKSQKFSCAWASGDSDLELPKPTVIKFFNNMIHVVAHLFITLHYGLTLWSPKLTWSFLQSVLVCCESY